MGTRGVSLIRPVLKGLNQAKILEKSVILFWFLKDDLSPPIWYE